MEFRRSAILIIGTLFVALVLAAAGCAGTSPSASSASTSEPASPAPPDLASPSSAVASYLAWISYAYRIGDSDVASPTMSPEEEVRVNSYVELNAERQRRISQVLVSFQPRTASTEGTHATVAAREVWQYRYLSADGARAVSPTNTASYETTYSVVRGAAKTWVVDAVEVRPLGEVR